uniref:NADH-ubiquinone oxidoreductase chain 4 n=1 Tax=Culcita novaeguineae TaxID=31170 RepID=A0A7S8CUK9_CULNO|nr:NADH dehydrogenase subunit 4 [Culcita novaeguineae]QPC56416.1 NADH dehydrogenase subunit 4 [Culcita novaeguineae]
MIYLILSSTTALILSWIVPRNIMWPLNIITSLVITCISLNLLNNHFFSLWHNLSLTFATDPVATPLLILSAWLTPIALIASIKSISAQPELNQRSFTSMIFIILIALILTFSALELTLFYVAFETTLLPTLALISRWGAQKERYQAGIYFLFYTLMGSLPLLIAIIAIFNSTETLTFPPILLNNSILTLPTSLTSIWWVFCLIAFIIKMPIYGFHLWLPKAHVEAPIAGSMILAAILLKLGGYGLLRMITIFSTPSSTTVSAPLIVFCIWGALITSIICLRQTDLKALIAYSSVGHMSMVASGIFSLSLWGLNGALTLMIAHGLISSALFCLANLLYERNNTRTLSITRGFKLVAPLLTIWWTITCVTNLGLPPTPNLIGELLILSTIIDWNTLSTPIITTATVFGAIYSLLILSNTNNSPFPNFISNVPPILTSEHTLMALHIFPLILIIVNPSTVLIN